MNEVIQVQEVAKRYGRVAALRGVSLVVRRGEIYGLIGPNGAGKTTLLSIIAGLRRPDAGSCTILGARVKAGSPPWPHRVGFFSPTLAIFNYLRGREMLYAVGRLHSLEPAEVRRRMADLFQFFDLDGAAGQLIGEYSHGMRMKLGLSCALIHAPEILLLDEPFTGLDPTAVYRLLRTLERLAVGGRTILLSSHDLRLVERICRRVGILHEGVLVEELQLSVSGGSAGDQGTVPQLGGEAGETATAGDTSGSGDRLASLGEAGPRRSRDGAASRSGDLEQDLWSLVGRPEVPVLEWLEAPPPANNEGECT